MGKDKTTTSTTQQNQLPDYMVQGSQRAVQMATDRTNQAYEGYGGQRIAGLSENEQRGMEGFRNEQGRYDQDFDAARGALDSVTSFTDEGEMDKYMNPYIEGVLQPAARRRDRAFGEKSAELRRTSGMRGAFGGRQRVAENLLEQSNQEGMDDLWAEGYGTAFDKATQLHGREQDRQLALAGEYGANAQRQADTNNQALRNLMESGFVDRTVEQSNRDFQYMEHLEERDWDVNNLNTLVQTLAAVPSESTIQTDSTTTTVANPVKTLIGVAAIVGGAIMIGMTAGAATPLVAAQLSAGEPGATVEGSVSHQSFSTTHIDVDRNNPTILNLHLVGVHVTEPEEPEIQLISECDDKPRPSKNKGKLAAYCSTCGRKRRTDERFCPTDGMRF